MIPKKLTDEIERWISNKLYGNLQINFSGGKILNVNRTESIKVDTYFKDKAVNVTATFIGEVPDSTT